MQFFRSLINRSKIHLNAPYYLKQRNAKIEELKKNIADLNDQVAELRQIQHDQEQLHEKELEEYKKLATYAQTGEDKILSFLFTDLGIEKPSYLDVGANYPLHLSNTYFLYLQGCYGVCIEPDPELYSLFKAARPRDICLNIGIGSEDAEPLPFYVFEERAKGLNTFSKAQADYVQSLGEYTVDRVLQIPLRNINSIIAEHFESHPTFLSIDVEGLDYEILNSLDYSQYPIDVICVETIKYMSTGFREKEQTIIDLLLTKGYRIYADTHINTIFVK